MSRAVSPQARHLVFGPTADAGAWSEANSARLETPEEFRLWPHPAETLVVGGCEGSFAATVAARANPHLASAALVVAGPPGLTPSARGCRLLADAYTVQGVAWRAPSARSRPTWRIEAESRHEAVVAACDLIMGWSLLAHLPRDRTQQLYQAMVEMALNGMEWGNRGCPRATVRIEARGRGDRVEVVITDQGPGFDPRKIPHAASCEDPLRHLEVREDLGLRDGGFGLMIARGMVDELRHNARGNQVTLIKRLDGPSRPRA